MGGDYGKNVGCHRISSYQHMDKFGDKEKSYPKRTTKEPYGGKDLPPLQQQRLDKETAGIAKLLIWMPATVSSKGAVDFLMELPADEERRRECDPLHVSVWQLELSKAFKSTAGMKKVSFNMGAYEHKSKKANDYRNQLPPAVRRGQQLGL